MANTKVVFTGIPNGLHKEAKRYIVEIPAVLRMSFKEKWGSKLRETWFGQKDTAKMINMLCSLDKYLNDKCTQITFVREGGDHFGSVWPTALADKEKNSDFKKPSGYLQVPSGLRIYLASSYDAPDTDDPENTGLCTVPLQRVNTIFHEMTHKILKTDDVDYPGTNHTCYGVELCQLLRKTHADLALNNADNWGFYMAACFKQAFGS